MTRKREIINIHKTLIPYEFDIVLDNKRYTFYINYNHRYDYFTVDLSRNQEQIVNGEKLVYGVQLFVNSRYLDVPKQKLIIPLDLTNMFQNVDYLTLGEQVFLYLFDVDELEEVNDTL